MNAPAPGLRAPRRFRNASKQPAKLDIAIPPGDELVVSDAVADQLVAARVGLQEADERVDALGDAAAEAVAASAAEHDPVPDVSSATKKQLLELVTERGLEVDTSLKVDELRVAVADALARPPAEDSPEA